MTYGLRVRRVPRSFLQTDPVGYDDNLNLYAFVRGDPLNSYDPTGERVIFIGGGGEGYAGEQISNSVQPYVERFRDVYGGRIEGPVEFYRHFDLGAIQRSIFEGEQAGEPIVLVAHSWGAASAYKAISQTGVSAILVTIDPVGGVPENQRPKNLLFWLNIELVPGRRNLSDFVEQGGNAIASMADENSSLPVDRADLNQQVEGNHEDFDAAMEHVIGRRSVEARVVRFGSRLRR